MKEKTSINLRKSMNRGSVEHETKVHDKQGEIMKLATADVVSIPPSKSIKDTAKVMMEHEFRRLPITDPGSGKVLGIVTVMDILDFFGGGNKFNIIEKKYEDNFLAAINEPVREIMTRDVICLSNKSSIKEVVDVMLSHQIGALPLVDADEKLAGIVTERDIALSLAGEMDDKTAQDYMSTKVFTTTPGTPIESACKIMVRNGLRRIPIVGGEADISKAAKKLLGIVTSTDIIRFFNAKDLFDHLNTNAASQVLETKLSDIMVNDAIVAEPEDKIGEICELFKISNIGGVPVVKDDVVIGIITERDILRAIKNL
jgi:CBS domain-containing protein